MDILGISAFYHDSAAALIRDGVIIAAAQEERFTRNKHDASFPLHAITYCLQAGGVAPRGLAAVVYYDKPLDAFDRIVRTFVAATPKGARMWSSAMSEWASRKLWVRYEIEKGLDELGYSLPDDLLFAEHHSSHAAAAFHPSPFQSACVLTIDGVGEWATTTIGRGRDDHVEVLEEVRFPHSLGLLYSAFTATCGFRVNSGEYKLMGLAPFGVPSYRDDIERHIVLRKTDGTFKLDMRYFDYRAGRRMTTRRFEKLFGPARHPEAPITIRECNLARSIQVVLEDIVIDIAKRGHRLTAERNVVLAGGVALNCVSNSALRNSGPFDDVWVQPASGDAGSAAGCALWAWHEVYGGSRPHESGDGMAGSLLGPSFDADEVATIAERHGWVHRRVGDEVDRADQIAQTLADGGVVGVFQGRMEFGPRALGNRSILADPRRADMQQALNLKIKHRESFRPFAPAVLAEHAAEWFDPGSMSPYMTFVAQVRGAESPEVSNDSRDSQNPNAGARLHERLAMVRSPIPAVTHIDGSARVQTVTAESSPGLHRILSAFHQLTGCPVLVNTSFNVRGEPIACTPEEAFRCFMTTDIDLLVIEDCIMDKAEQHPWDSAIPKFSPD